MQEAIEFDCLGCHPDLFEDAKLVILRGGWVMPENSGKDENKWKVALMDLAVALFSLVMLGCLFTKLLPVSEVDKPADMNGVGYFFLAIFAFCALSWFFGCGKRVQKKAKGSTEEF